ncbi:hypothetical protein [Salinispora mooreana]|uniref:hypothetical protein n=1 Tax=Salinispora mooreana TaxID=999545 RepID=UPI0004B6015F|nr:hypothetical protein [Salinispora mooreana]
MDRIVEINDLLSLAASRYLSGPRSAIQDGELTAITGSRFWARHTTSTGREAWRTAAGRAVADAVWVWHFRVP